MKPSRVIPALACAAIAALPPVAEAATSRISVSSSGAGANGFAQEPSVSADGRLVAFTSIASNLAPRDRNAATDVFVRDRSTGRTTLVSRTARGTSGNRGSYAASISPDGRYVAYCSYASNLAPGDRLPRGSQDYQREPYRDVFVHDRRTGRTRMVSTGSRSSMGDSLATPRAGACAPSVSRDGRVVTYLLERTRRAVDDVDRPINVVAWFSSTGSRRQVDVSPRGRTANGTARSPRVSGDGRTIAFNSGATNLVAGDTNGVNDTFVADVATRRLQRASTGPGGVQASGDSIGAIDVSADGRYIAFVSYARNLGPTTEDADADLFIRDRRTGSVSRASRRADGGELNSSVASFDLSPDGRFVAIATTAAAVTGTADVDAAQDLYLLDRVAGTALLISSGDEGASLGSSAPSLSSRAAVVVFQSDGAALVPGDANGTTDVFAWTRRVG